MSASSPSRPMVLEELARVLASKEFCRSPQLSRFLRFVVEETLDGRGETLKEYTIGFKVYDRGEEFDSRVDPIVRVQANKLRAKLAAYYSAAGSDARVRIELPKGGYIPAFEDRRPEQVADRPKRRHIVYALAGCVAVLILAVLLFQRSQSSEQPLHIPNPHRLTVDTGWTAHPAFSADGLLAFASDRPDGINVDIWVQSINGDGPARRLTNHPAIDSTPDFSPDGRRIAFRSFREGGGIYIVPVAGGKEILLAPGGFSPRFSPDGRWITYTAIEQSGSVGVFVIPADGGGRRRIQSQSFSCECPLWTPDGKGLIYKMAETDTKQDWWLAPFDPAITAPAPSRRIGFSAALSKASGRAPDAWTCPGDWLGRDMFFAGSNGAVYRMPFVVGEWTTQPPARLVLPAPIGGAREYVRTLKNAAGTGVIAFSEGQNRTHLWAVPVRSGGTTASNRQQLTSDVSVEGGLHSGIGVSRDGRLLFFPSNRAGPARRILVRDLQSGVIRPISPPEQETSKPVASPDGRTVAWLVEKDGKRAIFMASAGGSDIRELCAHCGIPRAWHPDGESILYTEGTDLWSLAVSTGDRKCLFARKGYEIDSATFSPDGSWVAMVVGIKGKSKLQGVLAPFEHLADEERWVPIIEEDYGVTFTWGAESDVVYYLSRRDDFRCLYSQRLRDSDKRPIDPPVAVQHFHSYQNYPEGGSPLGVAIDKIVLALSSRQFNIWSMDVPGSH